MERMLLELVKQLQVQQDKDGEQLDKGGIAMISQHVYGFCRFYNIILCIYIIYIYMYNYILDYIYIIRSVYIYDRQLKRNIIINDIT